jgi:protein-tyrosine-phosphatase
VKILTLCTGNVARSVMLAYMLTDLSEASGLEVTVRSAGTHTIEGAAMSARTVRALESIADLGEHHYTRHRSHQMNDADAAWADLILAAELDNVRYLHRRYTGAAGRSFQLGAFVTLAPTGVDLVAQMHEVSRHPLEERWDVVDPAGGDQALYDAVARELWDYARRLVDVVGS